MAVWQLSVIPYPTDLNIWASCDQSHALVLLDLPVERPVVLFGAMGSSADPRKGEDRVLEALQHLRSQVVGTLLDQLEPLVFGQSRPAQPPVFESALCFREPLPLGQPAQRWTGGPRLRHPRGGPLHWWFSGHC